MSETLVSTNNLQTSQICPVCGNKNEAIDVHCKHCAWFFSAQNSLENNLALGNAIRQYQLSNKLDKVLEVLEQQQQMLKNFDNRLGNIENEVYEGMSAVNKVETSKKYEYSKLAPIQRAEDFDTVEKRKTWWDSLELQWQKAFIANLLRKVANYKPTDEELEAYQPTDKDIKFVLNTAS